MCADLRRRDQRHRARRRPPPPPPPRAAPAGRGAALACDTDGIDGTEENAGALLSPDSLARAAALGLSARDRLEDNDGYGFFSALDDLVVTGPTCTNVNDFRAILIGA